ncbi:MAG: cytochrome c [Polyangiaceae bacterium]|nr:cytochrome c [Polyangiaceae bacterium]
MSEDVASTGTDSAGKPGKLKWVGIGLGALVAAVALFVATKSPAARPAPDVKAEATPAAIERGKYLFEHQLGCGECHTERDWTKYGGPPKGASGGGTPDCWGEDYGLPGEVCFPNLTAGSGGLKDWTDGEIARAIREGVDKDGDVLFPMMPYDNYKELSDADTLAVIAYLRSLPAVDAARPKTRIDFPVSFFIKFAPKPLGGPIEEPNRSDPIALGKYLTTVAGCRSCHSQVDKEHQPIPGYEFAGGQLFAGPWGKVRSPNLTPDPETGLQLNEQEFVQKFTSHREPSVQQAMDSTQNTAMPWLAYSAMTETDLKAIYAFLKTVKPVKNKVETRPQ